MRSGATEGGHLTHTLTRARTHSTTECEGAVDGTSGGSCELCPADKAQVACPGPECLGGVPEAEASVEMVSLKSFAVIDGVVATGRVRTVHPNLQKRGGETSHHKVQLRQVNPLGTEYFDFFGSHFFVLTNKTVNSKAVGIH